MEYPLKSQLGSITEYFRNGVRKTIDFWNPYDKEWKDLRKQHG